MRLLLLIMTGIGFTLGLLCGLLLHLPADGLPANLHPHLTLDNNDNNNDIHSRGRRSVSSDQRAAMMTRGSGPHQDSPSSSSSSGNSSESNLASRSAPKSSFQSPSNLSVDSNPFVSTGMERDNGQPQAGGQGPGQAERAAVTVMAGRENGEGGGEGGGEGEAAEGMGKGTPVPAVTPPVTSFTLRLRNAGGRFVVDSAVQGGQAVEDRGRESPAGDDSGVRTDQRPGAGGGKDSSGDKSAPNKTLSRHVVQGVLWAPRLDASCPRGVQQQEQEVNAWRRKAAGMEVVRMEEGCGRMQNRRLTFKDGSVACARYRLNTDQIQGEVYSYYLARLLRIPNLPPALLMPVYTLGPQWRSVHLEASLAHWADGRLVVLTRWLDHLLPSHIPHELREDDRKVHPTWDVLGGKSVPELCDLLQWSDLVVFDYLTANLDRMVNNMFNRQWNAEMMSNAAHNLERTEGGSLVFLDNESGLFHGYRLLEKYHGYHEALLSSLCVFRESTVRAVKTLHGSRGVGEDLQRLLEEGEEHHKHLPPMPEKNVKILRERVDRVYEQIVRCEALYGRRR